MPALVVAIAEAPASSNSLAVATSHAFGRTRIRGPRCNSRRRSAGLLDVIGFDVGCEDVLIHPRNDVLQPLYAMTGFSGARKLVRFPGELDDRGRDMAILQPAEHLLAAGAGRRSHVRFALHEQRRRFDLVDVSNGRARLEVGLLLPRRAAKPHWREQGKVGGVP